MGNLAMREISSKIVAGSNDRSLYYALITAYDWH
jgi:hypothetical protein